MSETISPRDGQTRLYNALVPPEGPKSVRTLLDFSAFGSYVVDFTLAYMNTTISVIQTIIVDNFANAETVSISVPGTGQTIEVPANAQGVFPIVAAIRPKISLTSSTTGVVNVLWLNVPLPAMVWYSDEAAGGDVSITGVGTRDNALQVLPPLGTATAGVAEITTGGDAVVVFAAGSIENAGLITNPWSASESLYVDFVNVPTDAAPGPNGTTIELKAGQSANIPPITNACGAIAATNGHVYTAVQW